MSAAIIPKSRARCVEFAMRHTLRPIELDDFRKKFVYKSRLSLTIRYITLLCQSSSRNAREEDKLEMMKHSKR